MVCQWQLSHYKKSRLYSNRLQKYIFMKSRPNNRPQTTSYVLSLFTWMDQSHSCLIQWHCLNKSLKTKHTHLNHNIDTPISLIKNRIRTYQTRTRSVTTQIVQFRTHKEKCNFQNKIQCSKIKDNLHSLPTNLSQKLVNYRIISIQNDFFIIKKTIVIGSTDQMLGNELNEGAKWRNPPQRKCEEADLEANDAWWLGLIGEHRWREAVVVELIYDRLMTRETRLALVALITAKCRDDINTV